MNRKIISSVMIGILLLFGGMVFLLSPWHQSGEEGSLAGLTDGNKSILEIKEPGKGNRPVKTFTLTAQDKKWVINDGKEVAAWTYNGKVPGEALRVTEGDVVRVKLKNDLNVPITIHWHGVLLPNKMDGIPGVTQNAVEPGDTFTYEFIANDAGTYWYHSHQQSSIQVDKGLYGSFVVEEKEKEYERDEVFILDEWAVDQERENLSNMGGMMMGAMSGDSEADTKQMYDTFTVNGKSGNAIKPMIMQAGEKARLRFINAGYQVHRLVFPEGSMRMLEADAEKVKSEDTKSNVLEIAPGERIDVEFTKPEEDAVVIGHEQGVDHADDMVIPVISTNDGKNGQQLAHATGNAAVKGTSYGSEKLIFNKTPNPDVTYDMDLSMGMDMGEGMSFQINNKTFPDTPPIKVKEGDIVKVTLRNEGRMNHPMHLHGHRFQVNAKDGKKLKQPVVKDLVHVKPGEEYEIYFKADNLGEWLFHCHDNNHAARGMVTVVDYEEVYSPFQLGGKEDNHPN
ncbi:multicopper oxidase family protein [Rossellomorea aquimaris]|uniref:multicopper oxidase family protein n=1 Tax=Rossellomorea aquimaris TaxID=189382 RepID=UPI001CD347B7|nr:multicopper oxidase family protein [Rossellomorea aquimaris]MCA1054043.1 multicopper oxidase family protein [Rossellomorea aquimaris]